ncbi:MAG TPA: hypothetical protein VF384_03060 [Planctomycetota bacterium]
MRAPSGSWANWSPFVAVLAAACAGVERPDDWHTRLEPAAATGWAAPGPFSPMDDAAIWGVGDRVVYTIELDDRGARRTFTFTLTTTALPPPEADAFVLAHPVHGHVLTRSAVNGWQHGPVIAYEGFGDVTLHAELEGDDGSRCEGDLVVESLAHWWVEDLRVGLWSHVHGLFAALLGLDCMHAALLRVIRLPTTWSVLASFGRIRVALTRKHLDDVPLVDQDTPLGRLPTAWLPMTITANGQPALDGRIQFTWKRSPLLSTSGVLQIEAWHPDDPARRVLVRLASATRGTPPDGPDPTDLGFGLRVGMTVDEACAVLRGEVEKVHARGRLADGRDVELIQLTAPAKWLFCVVHDGRLLYASLGNHMPKHFLKVRGFVPADGADR